MVKYVHTRGATFFYLWYPRKYFILSFWHVFFLGKHTEITVFSQKVIFQDHVVANIKLLIFWLKLYVDIKMLHLDGAWF